MKRLRLALILGFIPACSLLAEPLEREDALKLPQTLITGNRQVEARSDSTSANSVPIKRTLRVRINGGKKDVFCIFFV